MSPTVIRALQDALSDWRGEAAGSRRSADRYGQTAAEHRSDAERAEQAAAEIEAALREAGIEPAPWPAPRPGGATVEDVTEGMKRMGAALRGEES